MKNTLDYIVDKYGLRLNTAQIADAIGTKPGEIRKDIALKTFRIPLYKETPDVAQAPWFAKAQDVAAYLDSFTPSYSPASRGQDGCNASEKPKTNGRTLKQSRPPKTSPNQTNGRYTHVEDRGT